jgi:cytochrome c biogenesis protein CcmG, thiol:disulfide interchange protein DsbE
VSDMKKENSSSQSKNNQSSERPVGAIFGGLAIAALTFAGIVYWYQVNSDQLSVNKSPDSFRYVQRLEKEGPPSFTLPRIDGTSFSLNEMRGKVTIINFWASWCAPCVQEFPSMVKLVKELKGKVQVIAVSNDTDQTDLVNFVKSYELPMPGFEILWDKDGKVRELYGVQKIPESFIIKRDGKLYRKVLGIDDWSEERAVEFFESLAKEP